MLPEKSVTYVPGAYPLPSNAALVLTGFLKSLGCVEVGPCSTTVFVRRLPEFVGTRRFHVWLCDLHGIQRRRP